MRYAGSILCLAMLCGGCSLLLDWGYNGLPCEQVGQPATYACASGYTCNQNQSCVLDHSLNDSEACSLTEQCAAQSLCTQSFVDRACTSDVTCHVCATACSLESQVYASGPCGNAMFCAPFCAAKVTRGAACAPADRVAACVAGAACTVNETCNTSDGNAPFVCTAVSASANACVQACSFTWTGGYNDGCSGTSGNPFFCTPVGESGQQQLACIAIGAATPLAPGATPCDPFTHPCSPGYACVANVCSQLCNLTGASPCANAGQQCTAIPGLAPAPPTANRNTVGYCH